MWEIIKRSSLGFSLIVVMSSILLISDWNQRKHAAQPMRRIAIVQYASQTIIDEGVRGMRDGLAEHGFIDGQTVSIKQFNAENDIATANSILFTGAKPVFADVREDTFNIDPEDIERKITKNTKAIIPVDLYGHPADMDAIGDIARRHGLAVIEDACQAHGATCNGRKAGSFDTGCFSFYPTKNMTTSEGGIITTNDKDFADKARMVKSHGSKVRYYHEMLGFNLRMTDISAAIGVAQLGKVDSYNGRRIENARLLSDLLHGVNGIVTPTVKPGYSHVFHQYTIRVTDEFHLSRDEAMKRLGEAGIGSSIYYPLPIHQQPFYREIGYSESHPVSEKLAKEVLSLPVHPSVTGEDIHFIADTIRGL